MDWENKSKIVWAKVVGADNKTLFEWSQTIDDVKIRFQLPETTRSRNIDYSLTAGQLRVGLKGAEKKCVF